MKLSPVTSSNIKAVAYNAPKKVMHVQFTNETLYEYHDVPENVHAEMINSSSIGGYFSKNVARKFKYFKVENTSCEGCEFFVAGDGLVETKDKCKKYGVEFEIEEQEKAVILPQRLEQCDEPFFKS